MRKDVYLLCANTTLFHIRDLSIHKFLYPCGQGPGTNPSKVPYDTKAWIRSQHCKFTLGIRTNSSEVKVMKSVLLWPVPWV
jgi:hypothetical protein